MKQVPSRLAEALVRLCQKKSLESITVSRIAKEAGVTRQVFYHYFDDKFELASWVHYLYLYQAVKMELEKGNQQVWSRTMIRWMYFLVENKTFYSNVFQSMSQKEFQRIIRDFFYDAYKWQMEHRIGRILNEEECFVLHTYLYGGMQEIYDWISGGMNFSVERMVQLLELAMPEVIRKWILTGEGVPYKEALKMMEQYLKNKGLFMDNSEEFSS